MREPSYELKDNRYKTEDDHFEAIHREELLDEALMETFPASDALSTNRFD